MLILKTLLPSPLLAVNSSTATGDLGAVDVSIPSSAGDLPGNAALVRMSQQPACDFQGIRIIPYGGNAENNTGTMRLWIATPDNVGLYLGAVSITLGTLTHTFPWLSASTRLADTLTMTTPAFRTTFESVYGSIGVYNNTANGAGAVIIKNVAGANVLVQLLCDGASPAAGLNASVCLMV
jgi:hypothetical protein